MRMIRTVALLTPLAAIGSGFAGQASFELLTASDAAAVTIDEFGRTLVLTQGAGGVFIYEDGAYDYVGSGEAWGLSADGNWVAATISDTEGVQEAVRGAAGGGWLPLGGADQCDSSKSSGYGVSGDGSSVVGLAWDTCSARGFVWTQETGLLLLESLANGNNRASAISADGEVIAGFAQGNINRTPAVWLASTRLAHPAYPFDPDAAGEIGAVSSDGRVVAGQYYSDTIGGFYSQPYFWTESDGVVILPEVTGFNGGMVLGVSDDRQTLVGYAGNLLDGLTAAVWRPEWGAVDLKSKLIELGADVPGGFTPLFARGLTPDGETVVGWGVLDPGVPGEQSQQRAFVATLPPAETLPCPADLNDDGNVGFADLTQLLSAWGACPGCDEDIDDSGQVGFSDLTFMLNTWGPCP